VNKRNLSNAFILNIKKIQNRRIIIKNGGIARHRLLGAQYLEMFVLNQKLLNFIATKNDQ